MTATDQDVLRVHDEIRNIFADAPRHENPQTGSTWTVLLSSVAVFLIALEITIISVALPEIEAAFPSSSRATLSWVFTAYNVGVASLMLIAGWLAERDGRKRIFLDGMAIFCLGSIVTGLAPNVALLIGGRVVQSIGGAMLLPASLALILHGVEADKKDAAIGIWGAMAGLAAAVGPTLGALLVEAAGWRWVFLINVPIALVALILGPRVLNESRNPHAQRTADLVGPPTGAAGIAALVFAIVAAGVRGITAPAVVVSAIIGVVLLGVFVVRTRRHRSPIFPPALARLRTYRVGAVATLMFGAGFAGWLVLAPTFLVEVWGYSIIEAGFGIAPAPLAMAITAGPAGKLCARFGYRWVVTIGASCSLVAALLWTLTVAEGSGYVTTFLPGAILFGIGVGIGFPMLTAASMSDVPPNSFAVGAAGNTTVRQVAMAIGISTAVSVVGTAETSTGDVSAFQQSWLVCAMFFLGTALTMAAWYRDRPILDLTANQGESS